MTVVAMNQPNVQEVAQKLIADAKTSLTLYKSGTTRIYGDFVKACIHLSSTFDEDFESACLPLTFVLCSLDDKDAQILRKVTGHLYPNLTMKKAKDFIYPYHLVLKDGANGPGFNDEVRNVVEWSWKEKVSFRSQQFADKIKAAVGEKEKEKKEFDSTALAVQVAKKLADHPEAIADFLAVLKVQLSKKG